MFIAKTYLFSNFELPRPNRSSHSVRNRIFRSFEIESKDFHNFLRISKNQSSLIYQTGAVKDHQDGNFETNQKFHVLGDCKTVNLVNLQFAAHSQSP